MSLSTAIHSMHAIRRLAAIAVLATLTACANSLVPDLNNPSISGFQSSPTGASAAAIVVGMIRGARDNTGNMVGDVGSFGREGYQMGVAQGDLTIFVDGPVNPGTFYLDELWNRQYSDIRAGNTVLDAMPVIQDLTPAQKSAMAGFVQTMEAFDFTQLAATRDTFGIPIDVDISPTGPPAPVADKATVYAHILSLLDSGQTNLQAGGSAFSFSLPPGFAGFNTPATFLLVNRGLRARVDILTKNYAAALTDLGASFMTADASKLAVGPAFDFSANSGDETNFLFKPYYYVANWIHDSAQFQADGHTLDQRLLTKTVLVAPFILDSITASYQFTMYNSVSSPLPMLRNEELLLLKAEAELGLGMTAQATTDINFIRAASGNLPPWTANSALRQPASLLDDLLYEKRYSLLWESGNNWISMRQYGKLNEIPEQYRLEHIFPVLPFPLNECLSRSPQPSGCTTIVGF